MCWTQDGFLFVVESNRVLNFPAAEFFYEGPDVAVAEVVPQGQLIPPEEESFNHSGRVCRIGPDNKLYITLGQPFNVQPRDKLALYTKVGHRRHRAHEPGRHRARGVRHAACATRSAWTSTRRTRRSGSPTTRPTAWATTSRWARSTARRRPGSSSAIRTSCSKTRITEFGYDKDPIPAGAVNPQVMTDAHAADLGMSFYTGKQFPAKYQGGFFSAQHGSWNRTKPIGARVLFTSLKPDGTADKTEVFAEGWLDDATGTVSRPAGRRADGEGRLAARLRRLRGRDLPHHATPAVAREADGMGRSARRAVVAGGATAVALGSARRSPRADRRAGRAQAQPCAVCHGALGISAVPDAPNLAAQPALYVTAQLRAFRSGERRHEVMNVIAKPLTDDDIDALAAWFASIRIEAQPPP